MSVPVDPDHAAEGPATARRSIAIRTFITSDFMTGRPAVPGDPQVGGPCLMVPPSVPPVCLGSGWGPVQMPEAVLEALVKEVAAVPGVAQVLYDLTSKPPGTTEWE